MKLVSLYCPSCRASLKIDASTKKNYCYCMHCGQQIYIDDEVKRTEHRQIIEDVAKIKEVDYKEKLEYERYQVYKANLERHHKQKRITIFVLLALIFVCILLCVIAALLNHDGFSWGMGGLTVLLLVILEFVAICWEKPLSPDEQKTKIEEDRIQAEIEKSFWSEH